MKDLKNEVVEEWLSCHELASQCIRGERSAYVLQGRLDKFIQLLKNLQSQPELNPEPSAEAKKHRH